MRAQHLFQRNHEHGRVFFLFLLLAIVMCAALFFGNGDRVIGNAKHPGIHGEMFHQKDFTDNIRAGRFLQPFFSHQVAYPQGQDLRKYMGISLHLYGYIPLIVLGSFEAQYNAYIILTLALNGFCAYLLGRYLSRSLLAGLFCGLVFMLSPYAMLKLDMGFLQKTILWWIPLFLLNLFRFLDQPNPRDALRTGLFWSLMMLTYAPYAWYSVLFSLLLIGLHTRCHPRKIGTLIQQGWPAIIPPIIALILLRLNLPGGPAPAGDEEPWAILDAPRGGIDILHPFRGFPYYNFTPMVRRLPIGISILTLVAAVAALLRGKKRAWHLAFLATIFLLIATGPFLHTEGRILSRIPLPYYFLAKYVPGGCRLGFPLRAMPFVEIALASLTAIALGGLFLKRLRRTQALIAVLIAAITIEHMALWPELFPPRITSSDDNQAIHWLKDHGGVALHLPYTPDGVDGRIYLQACARSGTRMMNPYFDTAPGFPAPPLPLASRQDMICYLERLHRAGCDYIIIHPNAFVLEKLQPPLAGDLPPEPPPLTLSDMDVFRSFCGHPAFADKTITIYRIPPPVAIERGDAVSEEQARAFYDANPTLFQREEQRRIHHFLIPVTNSADADKRRHARTQAETLKARIEGDTEETFIISEALNGDWSTVRWGDLGYITRGIFPPEFDKQIFARSRPGEGCIIEQPEGYHIFVLMDVRPSKTYSFEESRQAASDHVQRTVARMFNESNARPTDDMVFIPGGETFFGSTEAEIDRTAAMAKRFVGKIKPVDRRWFEDERGRRVTVKPFFMDRDEVTVAEYQNFVKATGHASLPDSIKAFASSSNLPVVGVTLHDAEAYAAWAGKRLPTEEEWEWAARGAERRWFPWGDDEPDGSRGNYADTSTDFPWRDDVNNDGFTELAPIGSYPAGVTPLGLFDMGGNAREWTSTQRLAYVDPKDAHIWDYDQMKTINPAIATTPPLTMYAVRGGAWMTASDDLHCADVRMMAPDTRHETQGFRCVRDVAITASTEDAP